jgi:hypothetical protein
MQHLRSVGEDPGAILLAVPVPKEKGKKGKAKENVLGERVFTCGIYVD